MNTLPKTTPDRESRAMYLYQANCIHFLDRTKLRPRDVWDTVWAQVQAPRTTFTAMVDAQRFVARDAATFVQGWLDTYAEEENPPKREKNPAVKWQFIGARGFWRGTLRQFGVNQWFALIHVVEVTTEVKQET